MFEGLLHAGCLLSGMLNSALQRQSSVEGEEKDPKGWKSCKVNFLRNTEIGFSRFEEPFLFKGKLTNSNKLTTSG